MIDDAIPDNTITQPEKIIPVQSTVKGLGKTFTRVSPPWSTDAQ